MTVQRIQEILLHKNSVSLKQLIKKNIKKYFQTFLKLFFGSIIRIFYKVELKGEKNIPSRGAAILAGNHLSYIDGFFIACISKRFVRFIIDWTYYKKPILKSLIDLVDFIPIAPKKYDQKILEKAYENIKGKINEGELICIFPEAWVTRNGEIRDFYKGIERILEIKKVPVVPFAISGLWGSIFSWKNGKIIFKLPEKFRLNVKIEFGKAIMKDRLTAFELRSEVKKLKEKTPEIL